MQIGRGNYWGNLIYFKLDAILIPFNQDIYYYRYLNYIRIKKYQYLFAQDLLVESDLRSWLYSFFCENCFEV